MTRGHVLRSRVERFRTDHDRVPDNVQFQIDDVEDKEWNWPDSYFDYIHSRFMVASISSWPRLIRKAFKFVYTCYFHDYPDQ